MSLLKSFTILVLILIISSCNNEPVFKKILGSTMGTTYSVIVKMDDQNITLIHNEIEAELTDINQLMSTYIPNSEINQFNNLNSDTCFKFSDKSWHVLIAARQVYEETNGAFDITLGPLISRWGFDAQEYDDKVPTQEEVRLLLSQVGTDKLLFDAPNQCISKVNHSMTINLSAIAKGFAVDQIATILDSHQAKSYLVEIGGEVKAKGLKGYSANWKIAVEKPANSIQQTQSIIVNLLNNSIATSGDYRNYYEHNGKRFSHTISPNTGYPITHTLTSISVLHPSNMMADAYATALNVMGTDKALSFAKHVELPIYIIHKENDKNIATSNKHFQVYISQ